MGADMLLYCCEEPTDYVKAWPIIQYRIDNLDDKYLECLAEDHLWYDSQETWEEVNDSMEIKEEDLYKLNDLYGIKIREMVREKLKESVKHLIGSPENSFGSWRRDIAQMRLKDVSYIFSGGMSWGDQPSEACEHISLIDAAGLFDGMGSADFDYDNPDFKA